jgi:hypothetical protein
MQRALVLSKAISYVTIAQSLALDFLYYNLGSLISYSCSSPARPKIGCNSAILL